MNDDLKVEELTREQILDLADFQGRKLGLLLATCPLDDQTKKSITNIIENATLEQIDTIVNLFENSYLTAVNQDLNDWFGIELENIKSESDAVQEKIDKDTIEKIDMLEKSIKE